MIKSSAQIQQTSKNLTDIEMIDICEKELNKHEKFNPADTDTKIERQEDLKINITTKENYLYEITKNEVKYIGIININKISKKILYENGNIDSSIENIQQIAYSSQYL